MREFAIAQLMWDLARFGVTKVVPLLRLQTPKHRQRAAGKFRINQQIL